MNQNKDYDNKINEEDLINLADERLYKAKEGGRNQFVYD